MEPVSLAAAWAWIDAQPAAPGRESVAVAAAQGRRLAEPIVGETGWPDADRAAIDGYAVRAAACDGASPYNPLRVDGAPIAAGWAMPAGADAVLPLDAAQPTQAGLDVSAPVARGAGVDHRDSAWAAGTALLPAGHRMRPQDLGLLAALGLTQVPVVRQPRVRLVVQGPKFGGDALAALLPALLARDGIVAQIGAGEELASGDAAAMLIAGRSGAGADDGAAATVIAAGGRLAIRGVALHPGSTVSLGWLGGVPLLLLPGEPAACLAAYDLLAARLLRRLAGADPALPYAVRQVPLERKIAAGVGVTDIVQVRLVAGRARPLGTGLAGVIGADGFVVIAEGSEGAPAGATVAVHLYGEP